MWKLIFIAILMSVTFAAAQTTQPTTQPGDDYQIRMDELNRRAKEKAASTATDELAQLRRENAALKAENAKLLAFLSDFASQMKTKGQWPFATDMESMRRMANGEAPAARQGAGAQLVPQLSARLISLGIRKADYRAGDDGDRLVYSLTLTNGESRDITGAKLLITFRDRFGDVAGTVEVKTSETIKARRFVELSYSMSYNQFMDSDRRLAHADTSGMTLDVTPLQVFYAGGKKWEQPGE